MIPHSVLPGLARWFGLTPSDVLDLTGYEAWTFVSALPKKGGS